MRLTTLARRGAYLGYYFKELDWERLASFQDFVKRERGASRRAQWRQIIRDSVKHNISILEYYQFRFFELDDREKAQWAGTGTMYEFQRWANPPGARALLEDKRAFYDAYRPYFRHELHDLRDLKAAPDRLQRLIDRQGELVFKDATGNCGASVEIEDVRGRSAADVIERMERKGHDVVETLVKQHDALQALSPSGVNTVRVFTWLHDGDVEVLGCRLRISVSSPVDNLAAGNLAAPIDTASGTVCGPGIYSDMTKAPASVHPVTGVDIVGFQVPYWKEALEMVKEASLRHPQNRSIGWDIVITDDGPGLIEGNHDWCKLVWQLPVHRGLRYRLEAAPW